MKDNIDLALSNTISRCMQAFAAADLDELAPSMIIDEYLSDDGLIEKEGSQYQKLIWRFLENFCDAASHRMDRVNQFCSVNQGEIVLRDALNFLDHGDWKNDETIGILRNTYTTE